MVYCYVNMIDYRNRSKVIKKDFEGKPLVEHMKSCIANTTAWFCSKQVLLKIGGFDDVPSHQDALVILKMIINNYDIYRVPEILIKFYKHNDNNGISGAKLQNIEMIKKYRIICRRYYNQLNKKEIKDVEITFSNRIVSYYLRIHNKKEAKNEIKKSIKENGVNKKTIKMIIKYCLTKCYDIYKKNTVEY